MSINHLYTKERLGLFFIISGTFLLILNIFLIIFFVGFDQIGFDIVPILLSCIIGGSQIYILFIENKLINKKKYSLVSNFSGLAFHEDMLADLEFVNDPELEKKLKREWFPGLLELIFTDPVTAWRTISQRFRIR